jgi:AdoMet-dependent rRNA methyltransferase SPB1
MPTQSIIVGVDLAPIKPIPRVITFQSDITTEKCRATIRQHLKHWKADTVLHDGAPNVGTAWVQDAFSQAELVLQSMKLATEFLVEGGTFVTKVFRSKDYNPLLWVFKQLFTSVEATKPPSSRNVSAEIFVVCRGFKAPKRIDPKFLDPKHVFAELTDATPNNEARVFNPEKKKRKREGYEEGDYTQFKEIPVTEFINTTDPIAILGTYNKLSFQQSPGGDLALATLNRLEETTDEIRTCCEDLKILGKKEFRNLLRWRLKVREKFGLVVKKGQSKTDEPEEVAEVAPMDEELAIQEELQRLQEKESSKRKKERRKENEKKRKEIVRMQMHMTTPMDIGMEQLGPGGDDATFSLKRVERDGARDVIASGKVAEIESDSEDDLTESDDNESDDEGDQLERELDSLYEQYQERREDRDSKVRAKKARKDYEADEWDGFSDSDKEDDEESEEEGASQAAVKPAPPNSGTLSSKAAMFFDQDIFQDLGDVDDVEDEDSAIEMQEDDRSAKKESASEKQAPKDAKKNTQATEDFSDSEPEELDDPRKKNGQLGMFPQVGTFRMELLTFFKRQISTSSPQKPWRLPSKWPLVKRSPRTLLMTVSIGTPSGMLTVSPNGSSTTKTSILSSNGLSRRRLQPQSRKSCVPSMLGPSRR